MRGLVEEPGQEEYERRMALIARDWHAPAGAPRTANNLELLVMNYVRATLSLRRVHAELFPQDDAMRQMLRDKEFSLRHAAYGQLHSDCAEMLRPLGTEESCQALDRFAEAWMSASYARLEVGHKLAAALCLTDVPSGMDVRAPWGAWSLVVPPGLFAIRGEPEEMARIWCIGLEPEFVSTSAGRMIPVERIAPRSTKAWPLVVALIRAACLVLSNPDELRKSSRRAIVVAEKVGRSGPPDLLQARYVLGTPVNIDLRQQVADVISGANSGKFSTQFLVRGHFRMQAHGAGYAQHKKIWIEPFWKGPEEARVLLRSHQIGMVAP